MAEQAGVAPSAQSVGESLMAKLAQLQRVDAVSRLLRPHYPDDSVCGPLASAVVAEVGRARTFDRFACRLVDADGPSASLAELPLRVLHRLFLAARSAAPAAAPPGVDAPVVSFDSLRRARTTLDDFSKFYLPLHGLAQVDFFRWLPQLTFVEAAIYQLDQDNEELARRGRREAEAAGPTEAALRAVLESEGLLLPEVEAELAAGREYWALERRLCAAMLRRPVGSEEVLPGAFWEPSRNLPAGARLSGGRRSCA